MRLRCWGKRDWFGLVFAVRAALWLLWHRNAYDVVHTHGYPIFYFIPLAALKMAGKPNLYTMSMLGGDDPETVFMGRLGGIRRRAYRWITVKVPTSVAMRKQLEAGPPEFIGRFEHIPIGVDTERFRPATDEERSSFREQFSLSPAQRVGLFVGTIVERKGVMELVQAWAKVVHRAPGARLFLLGPTRYWVDGQEQGAEYDVRVRELIAELGIASHVTFLGERPDVELFMRNADVFCLSSKQEGLPAVFLEALASGTPIVTFEVGGAEDAVTDGVTGFRVPQGAVDAYADSVMKILCDDELRHRMKQACRAAAVQRFSLGMVTGRYLSVYRQITGRDTESRKNSQ